MSSLSAGLLMFRHREGCLQCLLVHPGGPYYSGRDDGVWTIPKGEPRPGEDLLDAARREFAEETGFAARPPFYPLRPARQKSGKIVHAWAFAGDCDPHALVSNTFSLEWPPRSGQRARFPEVDQAAFFDLANARQKIHPAQRAFLDELAALRPSGEAPSG